MWKSIRETDRLWSHVPGMATRVLSWLFLCHVAVVWGSGNQSSSPKPPTKGVCISQGGRFPPFELEGKPPRKVPKTVKDDLTYCRVYKEKTCCGRAQAEMAFVSVRRLVIGGEGNEECVALWEALECATCHPGIGTRPGPPSVCASFCLRVFDACRDAFFSSDLYSQAMVPCGPRDVVCSSAKEWVQTGTDFCLLAGYNVVEDPIWDTSDPEEYILSSNGTIKCFDGNPLSIGLSSGPPTGGKDKTRRGQNKKWGWFRRRVGREWRKWVGQVLPLGENVRWLIAGLVLTASALYWRSRALRGRRKTIAELAAKHLQDVRIRQQSSILQSPKNVIKNPVSKPKA